MKIDRSAIKHNAKLQITTCKPSPIFVAIVFVTISMIFQYLGYAVSGYTAYMTKVRDSLMASMEKGVMTYDLPTFQPPELTAILILVAISLVSLIVSVGFTIFCMNTVKGKNASFGNLLDGFGIFFKVIWLLILISFFTFMWTLLGMIPATITIFIYYLTGSNVLLNVSLILVYAASVPGILAYYRYRQALFIMIDNPDMTALKCITQSKLMMKNHKGELFVLDLSFIGWRLLSLIPFTSIWVAPYTQITYINYYYALSNIPQPNDQAQSSNK